MVPAVAAVAAAADIGPRTAADVAVATVVAAGQAGILMAVAAVLAAEAVAVVEVADALSWLFIMMSGKVPVLLDEIETLHIKIIPDCMTNVLVMAIT